MSNVTEVWLGSGEKRLGGWVVWCIEIAVIHLSGLVSANLLKTGPAPFIGKVLHSCVW